MKPCLPADDRDPAGRAVALKYSRERYRWSYAYPPGIPLAAEVPSGDGYSFGFLREVLGLHLKCLANHAASKFAELFDDDEEDDDDDSLLERLTGSTASELFSRLFTQRVPPARDRGVALEEYVELFATIDAPRLVELWTRGPAQRDLVFAWQRIAGANPMIVRRASRLPDHFPLDPAAFADVVPGDTLAAALAEGRAYLADYRMFASVPPVRTQTGHPKYVYAPIALFCQRRDGVFAPVAIQCAQTPGPHTPIWTPRDRWRWEMAKTVVQVADGNHHQAVSHLGRTHLVIEPFVLATYRQLSSRHPVHTLLAPHFEFTLAINDTAAHNLVAAGGEVELVLGCSLERSLDQTRHALTSFRLHERLPAADLRARGLDDADVLPCMPYRDDGMPVWRALQAWVRGYLRLYYPDDATVAADPELQAWLRELASTDGGRLPGVGAAQTFDQLATLVTFVIWTASAQHSAVNFSQFDFMSFIPNMPGAGYAPAPGPDTPDTEEAWQAMLTPIGNAALQCDTVYQLSNIRRNALGGYAPDHFRDPAVAPLLGALRRDLLAQDEAQKVRDRGRLLPYPYLRPANITQSIHI